ncbi:hypothetical protein ACU686_19130 [Yinghuangia aomiensis]
MVKDAFRVQRAGLGFSFVEILTMCPTGWFVDTTEAPGYLDDVVAHTHRPGVLKDLRKDPGSTCSGTDKGLQA